MAAFFVTMNLHKAERIPNSLFRSAQTSLTEIFSVMSMQLLSTISSIVGLLGVVGPTLYFLFCFLYDVLEAPSLARTVQTEIAAGASLLGSIPTVCQSEDSLAQPRDIYPLIENLSDILRDRLHDLRRLTDQLCWDQNMPLRNRFEWAMKVRRIQFAREHIETPKTSLQMSLTILHE